MTNRIVSTIALALFATMASAAASGRAGWTSAQFDELRSMSLASLEPLPPDPTNRVADEPRAADLGKRLFFDTRLSANGSVACGTCHQPDRDFQDGIALGRGVGVTTKRTMPIAATARAPFLFWGPQRQPMGAGARAPRKCRRARWHTRAVRASGFSALST